MEKQLVRWQAPEFVFKEKSPDWYWALGIIGATIAITSFFYDNFLFSVLILLSTFALALYGAKQPHIITVEIQKKGIRVERIFYPYETLEAYFLEYKDEENGSLILRSKRTLMPHIIIPISDFPLEIIDARLEADLPRIEMHIPALSKFMEYLGF